MFFKFQRIVIAILRTVHTFCMIATLCIKLIVQINVTVTLNELIRRKLGIHEPIALFPTRFTNKVFSMI